MSAFFTICLSLLAIYDELWQTMVYQTLYSVSESSCFPAPELAEVRTVHCKWLFGELRAERPDAR